MDTLMAFDLTKLAEILKDPNENSDDSDTETGGGTGRSSQFGPAQIAPNNGASSASANNERKSQCQESVRKELTPLVNSIWSKAEVKENETLCHNVGPLGDDPRKVPNYETYFRQSVTTEDMFLGLGNKTPATSSCEALIVEILLPGENYHKVQLDLKSECLELRSPNYILFLPLPQPVDPRAGNAKWHQDKEKLILTLVLARELDILNF